MVEKSVSYEEWLANVNQTTGAGGSNEDEVEKPNPRPRRAERNKKETRRRSPCAACRY